MEDTHAADKNQRGKKRQECSEHPIAMPWPRKKKCEKEEESHNPRVRNKEKKPGHVAHPIICNGPQGDEDSNAKCDHRPMQDGGVKIGRRVPENEYPGTPDDNTCDKRNDEKPWRRIVGDQRDHGRLLPPCPRQTRSFMRAFELDGNRAPDRIHIGKKIERFREGYVQRVPLQQNVPGVKYST